MIETFRKQLLALRDRLAGDVAELEEDGSRPVDGESIGGGSDDPVPYSDLGSDASQEEIAASVLANEAQLLVEVRDALDRIERGAFGLCEECGAAITQGRLRALPYARYCVKDAEKLQGGKPGRT
jgi:DnaK suppressor protein